MDYVINKLKWTDREEKETPLYDEEGVVIEEIPLWFGGLEFSQRLPLCVS